MSDGYLRVLQSELLGSCVFAEEGNGRVKKGTDLMSNLGKIPEGLILRRHNTRLTNKASSGHPRSDLGVTGKLLLKLGV